MSTSRSLHPGGRERVHHPVRIGGELGQGGVGQWAAGRQAQGSGHSPAPGTGTVQAENVMGQTSRTRGSSVSLRQAGECWGVLQHSLQNQAAAGICVLHSAQPEVTRCCPASVQKADPGRQCWQAAGCKRRFSGCRQQAHRRQEIQGRVGAGGGGGSGRW